MKPQLGLGAGLLMVFVGLSMSGQVAPSQAATTSRLAYLSWGDDHFYNYDFLSQSASSSNVDWPVTVLFTNNATVNKAKSSMESWSNRFDDWSTGAMYMGMRDSGSSVTWDGDNGKKVPACPAVGLSSPHYRVYGIGTSERLYNTTLGYWVPATTHRDYNECPPIGKRHGNTEEVEDLMVSEAKGNTAVVNDKFNLYNSNPYRVEGNHTWNSNAYASTIHIP